MILLHDHLRLSATDLSNHLACQHLTMLDRAVASGQLAAPSYWDPKAAVLRERGFVHERAYLDHLRDQGFDVVEIDAKLDANAAAQHTQDAMRAGVQVIAQATLLDGHWYGRADVLHRMERPSRLGSWSYEVTDTKLAVETRAGTILQLCLYSDLLAQPQGISPEHMRVVSPGQPFKIEPFRVADFLAYYRFVKRRLEAAVAHPSEATRTYPLPTPHCDVCRWWSECDSRRRADDHLCLVAGIHRLNERELQERGVQTLASLAVQPLPLGWKPQRGAAATYLKLREQARLQLETRRNGVTAYEMLPPEADRGLARLPAPSPGDVFLDLEGDSFVGNGGQEYLLGTAVLDGRGEPEYRALWALDRASERAAFEQLVDDIMARWDRHPDLHVYHFAPYDPSALKRLMGRHGTREDEIDRMLRAGLFVDLYGVFRQGVRAGVERYSIKQLEPLYDFHRSLPLRDASLTLRAVETALELGRVIDVTPEMRQDVELYNRDDCLSALRLRNWLEDRRRDLSASGMHVPRPAPGSGEPPEDLGERRLRVEALAGHLLDGVPADPRERTPEQQGQWLLAQLLDWHRREEKVAWWEFFRLSELNDEERLEDPTALSGLEFVARIGGTPKCPVDRYRFPPQEVEIRGDQDVYINAESKLGKTVELDAAARTVDIRKTQVSRDEHPTSVFAKKVVPAQPQAEALYRLGEWVAENGIDSAGPNRAARDLLLRLPPRGAGRSATPLRSTDEDAVAASRRLALVLDGGVLPVQGPPGTGKTYAGARMIIELVRAGRKVGITAQSHKVIRNLLDEVARAAREEGVRLQCIQKVDERSEVEDPFIEETEDNAVALGRLVSGQAQVGAGTGWLWARPDFARAVDVLVVDEAGQMSLANAVAVAQAARNVILIGDPRQLEQPLQGTHPEGTEVSALDHLLDGALTIPEDRGLFLDVTWRLHPALCAFTSEQFYEGRLRSRAGLERQDFQAGPPFNHSGLFYVPVEQEGNQNASSEEADVVASLIRKWLQQGTSWIDAKGNVHPLTLTDILIVAPYNAQVAALAERLPNARIGTVDKFQGQEAPVVIYSMATSSPEEAPRGMEFLYSRNRLNVATSRARCACILVASPRLFEPECRSPQQMRLANALCRYLEMAQVATSR